MEIHEGLYKTWLEDLDAWRLKFSKPLSRKQAVEVLVDDREFDIETGEFIEPRMDGLFYNHWEEMCNICLKELER